MITQDEYIPSMVHVRIEINGIVADSPALKAALTEIADLAILP